jgi:hypothetical protein
MYPTSPLSMRAVTGFVAELARRSVTSRSSPSGNAPLCPSSPPLDLTTTLTSLDDDACIMDTAC